MRRLNDFGKTVKRRLLDMDQNQKWLINEVRERTGMYMDSGYLSKLMTGRVTSAPMCGIVYEILGIKEDK